jgi:hypothetical protein
VTEEQSGKKPRKPPTRSDALVVPLPFDAAIKAALDTLPPPTNEPKKKRSKPRSRDPTP